ncbi:hypothetical protein HPP92_007839 [Vanilla planifolia]|uniref:Uncharacterized protein n=1 Tax=Vanilla planifolia TaxID=51239 RepID=A0A835REM1_VANPL|nr:hypothetical protein HPP92_007839 [Vanilla planifolia]
MVQQQVKDGARGKEENQNKVSFSDALLAEKSVNSAGIGIMERPQFVNVEDLAPKKRHIGELQLAKDLGEFLVALLVVEEDALLAIISLMFHHIPNTCKVWFESDSSEVARLLDPTKDGAFLTTQETRPRYPERDGPSLDEECVLRGPTRSLSCSANKGQGLDNPKRDVACSTL